jgi:uncharacterized protein
MDFEWDAAKAEENVRKHGIDFPTAVRVFLDPHRIEREDTRITYGETRTEVIGMVGVQVARAYLHPARRQDTDYFSTKGQST